MHSFTQHHTVLFITVFFSFSLPSNVLLYDMPPFAYYSSVEILVAKSYFFYIFVITVIVIVVIRVYSLVWCVCIPA